MRAFESPWLKGVPMDKKEPRDAILYAHIKTRNDEWIKAEMKRLGYKSKSEFTDKCFDELRGLSNSDRKAK